MNIWQIATGEPGRDYHQLFFDHDAMLLGPGEWGDATVIDYKGGVPNSGKSQVHNFAYLPKPGDRVLMRFEHEIIGVGEIPQGEQNQYCYYFQFLCVYGWGLSHTRRVVWAKDFDLRGLKDVYKATKQRLSFTQVHETHIIDQVKKIDARYFQRPLKDMPKLKFEEYTPEELGQALFTAGISNKNIEDILKVLDQAERLWYCYAYAKDRLRPSGDEVISHMLLPLFLGLGWSHQQIAVEWQNVDMAFFKEMPSTPENCVMILEAKGWGQTLHNVFDQPKECIKKLGLKNVKYILFADGANVFMYKKIGDDWDQTPAGYFNIWSMQKEYMLPKNTSLIETLVQLQPSAL